MSCDSLQEAFLGAILRFLVCAVVHIFATRKIYNVKPAVIHLYGSRAVCVSGFEVFFAVFMTQLHDIAPHVIKLRWCCMCHPKTQNVKILEPVKIFFAKNFTARSQRSLLFCVSGWASARWDFNVKPAKRCATFFGTFENFIHDNFSITFCELRKNHAFIWPVSKSLLLLLSGGNKLNSQSCS